MKKNFYVIISVFCFSLFSRHLGAAATIAGTVTDSVTRLPISGALVEAVRGNQVRYSTTTASNGTYSLTGVEPSNYTLVFSASGYQAKSVGVCPKNNQTTISNAALVPNGGSIAGTVTSAVTTLPIAGATVQIFQGSTLISTVLTNGSGLYSAPNLAPGSYTVRATAVGFATQEKGAIVKKCGVATVNFALASNPGSISGIVRDSGTNNPIAGALVEVYDNDILVGFADTDLSGSYTIISLSPGSYSVIASANNYQSKTLGASVAASSTTVVNFNLDTNPGSIAGTVTSETTGAPIAGAAVNIFDGTLNRNLRVTSVETDVNGNYSVDGFAPGSYTVIASANNFGPSSTGASVDPGTVAIADLALPSRLGRISGTVTDALTTSPIAGANIQIYQGNQLISTQLTDPSGNYEFPDLDAGSYTVVANADNYQIETIGAIAEANTTSIVNFELVANPGTISGTVTDTFTTNPIEGASVAVYDGRTFIAVAFTDVNGNYSIPNLSPGEYILITSATDYQSKSVGASVVASTTTTVDFALDPNPGSIGGTVTNAANGNPISGASIAIFQGTTFIASALTDSDGNYSIDGFAPGNYTVVANAPNFNISATGAKVEPNTATIVNFSLSSNPGELSGRVTDANTQEPLEGASIEVFDGETLIASVLTDPDGNYQIPDLAPGNYTVVANAQNYQIQASSVTITANTNTVANFALASNPGTISGTVTDALTTDPIPNARITIFQGTTFLGFALTDANGNYTFPDLAPGNYFVVARASGYRTAFSSKTVSAGLTTTADFALNSSPGIITGRITDACLGNPVGGVLVVVTDGSVIVGFGLSDNNGSYSIPDLAPGNYIVATANRNFVTDTSSALVGANTTTLVDFVLTPQAQQPASISGLALSNTYLTQTNYVHEISWKASPGLCVINYFLYRNGQLIAVLPSNILKYVDCEYTKRAAVYSVVTRNSFGLMSAPLSITFK